MDGWVLETLGPAACSRCCSNTLHPLLVHMPAGPHPSNHVCVHGSRTHTCGFSSASSSGSSWSSVAWIFFIFTFSRMVEPAAGRGSDGQ